MAKSATSSAERGGDPEERLLEEGLFPLLFGHLGERPCEPLPQALDLREDLAAIERGETRRAPLRMEQCRALFSWFQAIGTPGGLLLLGSLQAQSKLLQSCCLRLATHHPELSLTLPLYPWLKENLKTWTELVKAGEPEAAPLEVLIKSLRTWLNLDKAIGVISGESPLTFRAARNGLVLLDKWLGGAEELALSLPQGGTPEELACPLEAGLPLGALALARSAGHVAGALYLGRLARVGRAAGVELDLAAHAAGAPSQLGALALFDERLLGEVPDDETRPLTFLALHDLAQFTALHPIFAPLRPGLRWDDLHPGHRLRRAIAVAKDKGLTLRANDAAAYYRLTDSVCEALGWPEVARFLDRARSALALAGADPIAQLCREAFARREEQPTAFIDPFLALETLTDLGPAGTRLADFETSRETDLALAFALEAELYAAGFNLIFGTGEPAFACPEYRDVIGQLHSPTEMVRTYFGVERAK